MKIKLEMEITKEDIEEIRSEGDDLTDADVKEELLERMFNTAEDWVLHGQQPDFDWEEEK
jgi:NTP pyrophosphatase (non-canonical NTP hydrolase)